MKRHFGKVLAVLLAVAVLGLSAAAFAKETPPPPDKIKKLTFPGYKEFVLKNGMEVLVVEHHEQPMVSLYFVFKTGSALDPKGKESLSSFTIDQINKGTKTKTALQLAEWIESVGGSVGAFSQAEFSAITVSILSEYIDVAYEYLQDVVMNPTFPEEELEIIRERTKTGLELELSQPSAMAQRHFDEVVYGAHPYGKKATVESVTSITRDEMVAFYQKNCVANNVLVGVVGDVKTGDVTKAIEKYFGGMQPGTLDQVVYPEPPKLDKTKILLYHRPGAVQTEVYIGHLGMKANNPDWPAVRVGNRILGGGSDARLFMNIREDKGWTYGAYSSFSRERDYGYFQAHAAVRTEVTDSAVTEFMKEIKRIKTEPVSEADLTNAKNYLVGNFPIQIETPDQIAGQIVEYKMLGLGKKDLETYRDKTAAVTVADVTAAMDKYLQPENTYIVLVGDAMAVKDKVSAIADVELYDIAGAPLSFAALAVTPVEYQYDTSKLGGFKGTYALNVQTMAIGDMIVTIERKNEGGEEVIQVATTLSGMVSLNEEMAFHAADLSPISYKRTMQLGPRSMGAELAFTDTKCSGKVTSMESPEPKDVNVDLVKGTILDSSVEYAVSSLPLAVATTYRFPAVDTQSGGLSNVDVEVLEEVEVKTPAGSFMTYKIKVKRSDGEAFLYLGKDAPHFLVRQEVPAQQMTIELKAMSK
jgi:predicted Zn-dependent peptidase